jgi:hypothetical protein
MRIFRGLWLSILSAAGALGCGRQSQPPELPQRPLPRIDSSSEAGFADLSFTIQSRERVAGGERLVAAALDGQNEVAFVVTLAPQWEARTLGGLDLVTHSGVVTIGSAGGRSDELLRTIDRLYATRLAPQAMSSAVKFAGISLEGNPGALDTGATKIKIFFESDAEDRYAEAILNVDVINGTIALNEKDLEYRPALVRALSGQ